MKKLNKIISLMLILSMLLASFPAAVFAEGGESPAEEVFETVQDLPEETVITDPSPEEDEIPAEEPVYEPASEGPDVIEPVYEEPVYEEPVNEEPIYEEPAYGEPVYQEPEVTDITADEAESEISAEPSPESDVLAEPEVQSEVTAEADAPARIDIILPSANIRFNGISGCFKLDNVFAGFDKRAGTIIIYLAGGDSRITLSRPSVIDGESYDAGLTITGAQIRDMAYSRLVLTDNGDALYGFNASDDQISGNAVIFEYADHGGTSDISELVVSQCEIEATLPAAAEPEIQQPAEESTETPAAEEQPAVSDADEIEPAVTPADESPASEDNSAPEPVSEENTVPAENSETQTETGTEISEKTLRFAEAEILMHVGDIKAAEVINPEDKSVLVGLSGESDAVQWDPETGTLTASAEGEAAVFLATADPIEIVDMIPVRVVSDDVEIPQAAESVPAEAEPEETGPHFASAEYVIAVGEALTLEVVNPGNEKVLVGIAGDTDAVQWDEEALTLTALSEGKVTAFLSSVDPVEVISLAEIRIVSEAEVEIGQGEVEGSLRNAPPEDFTPEWMADLRLDQDYVALNKGGTQKELTILGIPDTIPASDIQVTWEIQDTSGAVYATEALKFTKSTSKAATVAPLTKAGYGIVTAIVKLYDYEFTARCRVDVIADSVLDEITGASLVTKKATVELFKTDYTRVKVVLEFPQNRVTASTSSTSSTFSDGLKLSPGPGMAIQSARFADLDTYNFFNLSVFDDRTLEIRPDPSAVNDPSKVKSSYKSAIIVEGDGWTATTDILTLSVKKTLPKIKVQTVKFNSFNDEEEMPIIFTGDAVESVTPDTSKTDPIPSWLELKTDPFRLKLKPEAKNIKKTEKVYLLVKFADFHNLIERPVSFSVTAAATMPKLNFKPAKLTINPAAEDVAETTASVNMELYEDRSVYPIQFDSVKFGSTYYTDPADVDLDCTILGDEIMLEALPGFDFSKAKSFTVYFSVAGAAKAGSLTLKTLAMKDMPSIKINAVGNINPAVEDSPVHVTVKPNNFISPITWYPGSGKILRIEGKTEVAPGANKFWMSFVGNDITITAGPSLKDDGSDDGKYVFYVEGKVKAYIKELNAIQDYTVKGKVGFTVKTQAVSRSATLKTFGFIDVIRPETSFIKLTPQIKNWYGYETKLNASNLKFYLRDGKNYIDFDPTNVFNVTWDGESYEITADPEQSVIHTGTDKFFIRLTDDKGELLNEKYTAIQVKMGAAKLTQSAKTVELLRYDRFDTASVRIGTSDPTLSDIYYVTLLDTKGSEYFELEESGYGLYTIHYRNNKVTVPANTKSVKLTLGVYLKGNNTLYSLKDIPNAKINVTVNIANTIPYGDVEY